MQSHLTDLLEDVAAHADLIQDWYVETGETRGHVRALSRETYGDRDEALRAAEHLVESLDRGTAARVIEAKADVREHGEGYQGTVELELVAPTD